MAGQNLKFSIVFKRSGENKTKIKENPENWFSTKSIVNCVTIKQITVNT